MKKHFLPKSESVVCQEIKDYFNETPLATRNCVKGVNSLIHHLSIHKMAISSVNNLLLFLLRSFQSDETYLKRIIYACIIELSKHTDQGFVSINILVKDLNSKIEDNKTEVLKALFTVVPKEMVYDFEKYVTQALISNNFYRADAGVVICYLLLLKNYGKVKSWITNTDITNDIYGYHKLALLEKGNLLVIYNKVWVCKEAPAVLAVRILSNKLEQDPSNLNHFKNFLNSNFSSEAVFFEACKCVVSMKDELAVQFINQALQGLKIFVKSQIFSHKFASIRIISLLSLRFPKNVAVLNNEIEQLLSEDSKTISMLAISTLLKTGTEETVDRLVKMLPEFMNEMDDHYKKISIDTLEYLSNSYSSKRDAFVNFLARSMQERGALDFKMHLLSVLNRNIKKDCLREKILDILCMYVEDSEHHQLSMEILGILGREIPHSVNPRKYLLHVYNRLILEDNKIRSAALQCLYNLSMRSDSSIGFSTIKDCVNDADKMVSSISKFLLGNLENKDKISCQEEFDIEELGDLKEQVLKRVGVKEEEFVDTNDQITKEPIITNKVCREITISKESSDIEITLIKKISFDKENEGVSLKGSKNDIAETNNLPFSCVFKLKNKFEDVQVLSGRLSLKIGEKTMGLEIPTILPQQTYTLETEVSVEVNETIYGVFDYELCVEEDVSETENESTSLIPFMFSYFDLSMPIDFENRITNEKTVRFVLNRDLTLASKKILDLLNLKIIHQESCIDKLSMSLAGQYNETIYLWM
ncbi:Coatomer subunit gamma-2 [Nosema bombycis CQ1]|uniref:Coatomer subunit gamma-2 n=1 Tax=Nosema bombycis (strain CQ1 / CVCC 102059) TaxID=578461 RepID=R0M3R8_NOSB1|nr:Coatomer subunit gamma-2 [Nosema bombycis CQ1]|eukprot:EOB12669.1 Coatomer subunit gamma-2 [Nosema bombycis CQ1]